MGKSGFVGVYQTPATGRWVATIGREHLGTFDSAEEAARYRDEYIDETGNTRAIKNFVNSNIGSPSDESVLEESELEMAIGIIKYYGGKVIFE